MHGHLLMEKSILFHSSFIIALSSLLTLADNDQNDVIKETMTITFTSDVLALTRNAVDINICGVLCIKGGGMGYLSM